MSETDDRRPTYPGGIDGVLTRMEGRRDPLTLAEGEGLPPADLDLAPLTRQRVGDPDADPAEAPPFRSGHHRKRHAIRRELTGASELCALHGLLIAHLRKRDWPAQAPALFRRLWAEHPDHLLQHLDPRWLVSAVTTFGDHGESTTQRSVGLAMTVLFGTMKLYESERLYSGHPPERPFAFTGRVQATLPLDMDAYALADGGLDVNMIGRLWSEAEGDAVIRPLAHHLLDLLVHDDRTLFRRLMTMRQRRARREDAPGRARNPAPVPASARRLTAATLRWGIVSTVKAPLRQVARFAAHHIELGAQALHIHLDAPAPETAAFLSRHPRLQVTQCDADYWAQTGKARMEAHQLRQVFNATRCLRALAPDLDWLAHLDVDELLLPDRPIATLLADVPPDRAWARIAPAEALSHAEGRPGYFKLSHLHGGRPKAVLQDVYPTFGLHLYGGFLSHTAGKVLARTGIEDTRLGIHSLKYHGTEATNRHRLTGAWLGHLHAPSWEHFRDHLAFRLEKGSYRRPSGRPEMGQAQLIDYLRDEEGEAGLRALFDEVCADTPELRQRLAAQGMLLHRPLDLDAAVTRVFGKLP
ncbi:glycosyltransferase family 2 protein [Salipiger mucosus]|uniref:Glycosyl transferase family 2 n=1 Tax=Salipiger mucosus DSM 16094 TaxID=1123237 RepID=S9QGD2_9RHOB|nr:glycosyltransferase family 2 protein [Salipiger mucosus]EPX80486.1 hypothetical protein Salmuc_03802 [Salipiger mucosus DSM 16094]